MAGIQETLSFAIGVLVSMGASVMDAAGINLLKLDHVKNSSKPIEKQRSDCGRPMWHLGLYLYILSQVVGSTIALNFLQPQWVAPLGSVSLIFNFIFARVLVGTKITKQDLWGTLVIVISVIWVVGFGGINQANDDLDIERLKELMLRPLFVIYFSILNLITFSLFGCAMFGYVMVSYPELKKKNQFFNGIETSRLQNWVGMTMASVGGLLASQTILLAKSGVKLLTISISEQKSQFTDKTSWFILLFLMLTATLQVYCLNTALKLLDSVLVVPMFYGFYTTLSLVNTMIYLDELSEYPAWVLLLIAIGIAALVYGVLLLSEAKEDEDLSDDEDESDINTSKVQKRHKKKDPESEDVFVSFDKWLTTLRNRFRSGKVNQSELQMEEFDAKPKK
ncbi:25258_t:CDS:2 [Dentiscutata erythropus]|uniref:25258_t:CDS:1 n=1 Tax=Dentiscutata erythropus TaxID=1348616 RepID=A0A9N9DVM3_9GLOM|nr:25258_t:CDS:2 [Dentiscutata erythropus]